MEVRLEKQRHINGFLKHLAAMLNEEQKQMISEQASSRVDEELNLYLRFDKDKLIQDNKCRLTDSGNCYHRQICFCVFKNEKIF